MNRDETIDIDLPYNPTTRWICRTAGYLLLALGAIGLALPVLPTTIFWIGAAACFAKSSPDMYRRLINHGRIGRAIYLYLEYGVMGTRGKHAAAAGMALAGVISLLSPIDAMIKAAVIGTLGVVATYVLTLPEQAPVSSSRSDA